MNIQKVYNKQGRLIVTIKSSAEITEAHKSKVNNGKDLIKPKESKLKKSRTQLALLKANNEIINSIDKKDFLAKKEAKKLYYKSLNRKGLRK